MKEECENQESARYRIREADLALARRGARGDRAALHQVVERHVDDLFRLARGLCPSVPDAEDMVQETLFSAFRKIETFDGRASLLTWMSRILIRRTRKQWGSWHRRTSDQSLDELLDSPVHDSAAWALSGVDCRLDLMAALPRLAMEHREVIVLRELQGMAYADIAATLGIPQGTVESRIHRARAELRKSLGAYARAGGGTTDAALRVRSGKVLSKRS